MFCCVGKFYSGDFFSNSSLDDFYYFYFTIFIVNWSIVSEFLVMDITLFQQEEFSECDKLNSSRCVILF